MSENMSKTGIPKTVAKLLVAVAGMFCFGFLLVPLYDVFCEVTGLNGKVSGEAYQAVDVAIDTSRTIKVQFVATNNDSMPWEFKPHVTSVIVHPGELVSTTFYAKNPRTIAMTAQAIPSVMPLRAAEYFHKTECFCFSQQILQAGEEVEMPLRFIVDQDTPKDVHTITLSYTLFDVTDQVAAN